MMQRNYRIDYIEQGKGEGIVQTAKNFIQMGLSIEKISEGTGLSTAELEKLVG